MKRKATHMMYVNNAAGTSNARPMATNVPKRGCGCGRCGRETRTTPEPEPISLAQAHEEIRATLAEIREYERNARFGFVEGVMVDD